MTDQGRETERKRKKEEEKRKREENGQMIHVIQLLTR